MNLVPSHNSPQSPDSSEFAYAMVPQPGTDHAMSLAQPPEEEGVNWGRYVSALKRYKWLMLLITIVGTSGGVVATRFIPQEYIAKATIWVEPGPGKSGPIQSAGLLQPDAWSELLRTYVVFDPVVEKLALFLEPENPKDSTAFKGFGLQKQGFRPGNYVLAVDAGGGYSLSLDGVEVEAGSEGDSIGRSVGFTWQPAPKALGRDRKLKFSVVPPRDASSDLQLNLKGGLAPDGNFLRLQLSGRDPVRTATTLNTLINEFVDVAADLKRKKLTELRAALEEQLTIAGNNLRESESRLQNFRIQTITLPGEAPVAAGLTNTTGTVTGTFFNQKISLDALRQDRKAVEDLLAKAGAGGLAIDLFQTVPAVRNAPDLMKALNELSTYEADVRALRYRYTDEYKGVQNDLAAINTLKTQTIPTMARALVGQLKAQEADMEAKIGSSARELKEIPARTITEMRLTREMMSAENLFRTLQGRYETAKLEELSSIPDLRVLDAAVAPKRPTKNSAPRIILMALVGSLGAAAGLSLLLDQLDKRFRYPEQVSQELGLSILGAIPAIHKARGGELAPEEASQVVEAFRTIRLNLAHSYGSAGPVMLTISSPGAGDGKSLVCSNLAVSFADAGYNTLLIDGDTRRGELHRMFAIDRRPGLLDYLMGNAKSEEIIRPSSHKGLSVIPCGTRRQQAPELLGSNAMRQLMVEVKARYNVILVDSPPLGAGIDPFVLGTTTGHLMMVFRSGETDRQMAEAKLKLLDRLPVRVLGAVLNDVQADGVYRYYNYLYGYVASEDSDTEPSQLTGQADKTTRGV